MFCKYLLSTEFSIVRYGLCLCPFRFYSPARGERSESQGKNEDPWLWSVQEDEVHMELIYYKSRADCARYAERLQMTDVNVKSKIQFEIFNLLSR